jgi:hypothetical protein
MRIITVSPGYNWKYRDFFYSFDKKIINGLIRSGHSVVPYSDRDVADSVFGMRTIGTPLANKRLLAMARSYTPDLIVLLQADLIWKSTLLDIKAINEECKIINIHCDLADNERRMQRLLKWKGAVDATLITSGGFPLAALRREGFNAGFIPNPTDTALEDVDCYTWPDKFFDIVYVSSVSSRAKRWALVRELAARAPDIRVGSFGADKRRVLGRDYFNILRGSRAALNWSERNDIDLYASDRIGQLFGVGACVCLARSSGFQRFFSAEEAIFFVDAEDLGDQLRAAKASGAWAEIGKAGQKRYRELFNETRVARYVVDYLGGGSLTDYEWAKV